jgi:hypothetical protein
LSDPGRPRTTRERWASDHERARQRAAERLSLPLPAAEQGWLDRHLRSCGACAAVAADYAAEQAALRALEEPIPPRDLWARTAAALDRAERQASRDLNPSVFPGRGGTPGSRGSRSIRGLRAEQRASAFRAAPRGVPQRLLADRRTPPQPRPPGLGWVAPFGALAAVAIVIVVGGNALLNGSAISPLSSPLSADASASVPGAVASTPIATPIQVGAGEVAWLTPADDGSYSLNFASVDTVCPANAKPDCAPIAPSSPRHFATVGSALHTVIRSPSKKQLVVVPTSTKMGSGGGSVIVVAVPTPVPTAIPAATATATANPTKSASPAESPSAGTATATATSTASDGASGAASSTAPGDSVSPAATDTATPALPTDTPSPADGTPAPTATATPAATDTATASVPGASETPETSASVEPSAPQPTASALAIISDVVVVGETAAYSPDGTMLAFSARPADGSRGPDIYLWRPGDAAAHPVTSDHASVFSGWLSNQLLGSRAITGASPQPSSGTSGTSGTSGASETPSVASPSPSTTESATATPAGSASAADDAVGVGAVFANAEGAASVNFPAAADVPASAVPQSFVLDAITLVESDLAAPAWRPVVDPTGRFVAYWAGTLRYDPATLAWRPDRGTLVLASWPALRGSDPGAALAPVPLLGDPGTPSPAEWDMRWDEGGTHLAIWIADAGNPDLGRLNLLTIDATGRVDPTGISLHDAPALAGFSIGSDRLAWATPPGQDGEGSRLQVLAWSGENAGNIDSQPASGGDAVVVVR